MPNISGVEWQAEHDNSNYPFEDGATLNNWEFSILPGVFIDAVLYPLNTNSYLYLSSVTVTNTTVLITIGDANTQELCSGSFSLVDIPNNVVLSDANGRDCGLLISETMRLAAFAAWPNTRIEFEPSQTRFVAGVIKSPTSSAATALVVNDTEYQTGEVWLVGGEGVILDVITAAGGKKAVRVHAVGDPLFKKALCSAEIYETPKFLRTLVVQKGGVTFNVTPNSLGDIQITVGANLVTDTVLRIESDSSGLIVGLVGEKLQGIT
jgi:hypothetical protein